MNIALAVLKLTLYVLWCLLGIPVQAIILVFTRGPASLIVPLYWHRVVCRLFNIKVEIEGEPVRNRQVVLASNHISYLDIEAFSCITPWSFVAKAQVASWPLFGTLARLQQTAFTSRSRFDAMKDRDALSSMLTSGKNLIIFPEGTSSDGGTILPFRSSLLGAAFGFPVQPVTIALLEVDGLPASEAAVRDLYAWHGDQTLMPHLWRFARSKGARLRLIFHPVIEPSTVSDRKVLAQLCETAVRKGLTETISRQDWRNQADPVKLQPIKEKHDEFFDPGSQPPANLSADKVR
jgi:1-acyl-sn-glycerol-3-phosphate acyltransferase